MSLRITGGEMRGRRLTTPDGHATRPTASRVREAVFSMLGPIHGLTVIDLCSGSGTLAYEAISRGAASAVLIDDSEAAARGAEENAQTLGCEQQVEVWQMDALRATRQLAAAEHAADLIFLDAPYRQAPRIVAALDPAIPAILAPGGRVVLECDRRNPARLSLPLDRERSYGDVLVQIYAQAFA